MTRIIRMKDGTEYPCEMCGMSDGCLWIETRLGMAEAWAAFSDTSKTEAITDTYAGEDGALREIAWEGYTDFFFLSVVNGIARIGLKKAG